VNRSFEAEAALRELERLHTWVESQRRNLRRIKELNTNSLPSGTTQPTDTGKPPERPEK
jgi:hypothetical protein